MNENFYASSVKHFQYLPSDWKLNRLDQLVSQKITYGIVQPGVFDSSGIPLIRGVDYMSGWNNLNSIFRVSKDLHQKFKRSTTQKGDVLLSIAGYAGHVSVVPEWIEEANITQTTARISIDESAVSSHFVAYFLGSIEGILQSRRYIKGSAQEGLNLDDVQKFLIPIPPLPEQKKIASILTSVDEVIETTQKQIYKLQELKKATMNELLTKGIGHTEFKDSELGRIPKSWEVRTFGAITNSIKSGLSRRLSSQDIGIPVINSGNISTQGLNLDELKYWFIDDPQGANTENYFLRDKDILLNFINSTAQIGKSCIFYEMGRDCIYTTNLFRIRVGSLVSSLFLHYLMTQERFQKEISVITKPAVNQASFTKDDLEEITVQVPSLPEQVLIVKHLSGIEKHITKYYQKLTQTQSLKKSLMQDLLTGKVRVKVN